MLVHCVLLSLDGAGLRFIPKQPQTPYLSWTAFCGGCEHPAGPARARWRAKSPRRDLTIALIFQELRGFSPKVSGRTGINPAFLASEGSEGLNWAKVCDAGHSTYEQVNIAAREDANPLLGLAVCNDNLAPESTAKVTQKQNFTTALVTQLPALRRYAIALTGRSALADDLVQDCFERALGHATQLREPERLGGWLRRILYHLYIDEVRRRKTRGREQDVAELADHLELSTPAPDNSREREFTHAVNRLSAEHRQILLLVSVEELSYREIAAELDLPIGTVMSRLARARERLRSLLEEDAASFKATLAGKISRE